MDIVRDDAAPVLATETTKKTQSSKVNDIIANSTLPLIAVKSTDVRQPLYRYFELYGKTETLVTENIVEELVFDNKRVLFNYISKEQLYERDMKASPVESSPEAQSSNPSKADADANYPRAKAKVNENGVKVLHRNAAQRARNIKRQREQIGRQAESEPQRLRARIADTRVEFFLERWNRRDRYFAIDHPELADPSLDDQTALTEDQIQRERGELLKRASLGVLGQVLQRNRGAISDRGTRTGTSYSVSSEELGTSRLHPSVNPSIPRVRRAYREAQMEQPRFGEEGCVNAHECYCYKGNISLSDNATYFSATNTSGFVCKQFMLPKEELRYKLTGKLPEKRRPCIVCKDVEVTRCAYEANRNNIQISRPIHDHCVYTGVKGEYDIRQCIPKKWSISGRDVFTGVVDDYPLFNGCDYLHDVRVENGAHIRILRFHPRAGF